MATRRDTWAKDIYNVLWDHRNYIDDDNDDDDDLKSGDFPDILPWKRNRL